MSIAKRRAHHSVLRLVHKKIAIASMLLGWLCANGAIWDCVQVYAWTRMFAAYAAELPPGEALQRTFDPGKPCALCKAVRKGRVSDRSGGGTALPAKESEGFVFITEAPPVIAFVPVDREWPELIASSGPVRSDLVPVPPPRA